MDGGRDRERKERKEKRDREKEGEGNEQRRDTGSVHTVKLPLTRKGV